MPWLSSSPIAYPPSSSPAKETQQKRKRAAEPRSPLLKADGNAARRNLGAFIEDDSDEEGVDLERVPKRRSFWKPPRVEEDAGFKTIDDILGTQETQGVDKDAETVGDSAILPQGQAVLVEGSSSASNALLTIRSSSGRLACVPKRLDSTRVSYERLIASRSKHVDDRADKSFYGVDIHRLMDEATAEMTQHRARRQLDSPATVEATIEVNTKRTTKSNSLLWTEKYRARKFTDLVGDERTHRSVLKWLKGWDEIVFPGATRNKPRKSNGDEQDQREPMQRKILMVTGPPGLGKTTLVHVCAKQAGYGVHEINASDERSSNVVKGRIRDMVATENVRGGKAGKPVCVVVDEVDGVVAGSSAGGGEGGFVKALIDLILLDQRNSKKVGQQDSKPAKKRKGDNFRLMRPLVLICNDVYHPSLRPLRQSSLAEIIHIRKPPLNVVALRMQTVFEKEQVPCDGDGVRRLCEAVWGVSNHKEGKGGSGTVEGDIRSVMVVAEWVAGKLRSCSDASMRLTRRWFEQHVLNDLAHGGGAARSLGRGGAREVAERIFLEGAGFPKTHEPVERSKGDGGSKPVGVAEARKRKTVDRLREMIDMSSDVERVMTDLHSSYPTHPYQDDTFLSKPNMGYEWLHFHDSLSSQVFSSQEWELAPYLSSAPLAFHNLFASSETKQHLYSAEPQGWSRKARPGAPDTDATLDEAKQIPFSGPSAPFQAAEAQKQHNATISHFQGSLSLKLGRMYRSTSDIATELLPYALRILSPDVQPVIVNTGSKATTGPTSTASVRKASERMLIERSVEAMIATGIKFDRTKLEDERHQRPGANGWVFRMEPAIDELASFETMDGKKGVEGTRYAIRQVLDAEWRKEVRRRESEARGKRGGIALDGDLAVDADHDEAAFTAAEDKPKVKRDFFGRELVADKSTDVGSARKGAEERSKSRQTDKSVVFCTFHEGYSNAVRKPISLAELLSGM